MVNPVEPCDPPPSVPGRVLCADTWLSNLNRRNRISSREMKASCVYGWCGVWLLRGEGVCDGDKAGLEVTDGDDIQPCEHGKNQGTIYFRGAHSMVYEL